MNRLDQLTRSVDVSYLAPRDPSILSRNGRPLPHSRRNLEYGMDIPEEVTMETEARPNLRVCLRLKPVRIAGIGTEVPSLKIVGSDSLVTSSLIRGKQVTQSFRFSEVLGERSSQQQVFSTFAKQPLEELVADGRGGVLMTYGTTNAGKTHTMFGSDAEPGIIPLALSAIFAAADGVVLSEPQLKPTEGGVTKLSQSEQAEEVALRNKLLEWNPKLGEDTFSTSTWSTAPAAAAPALAPAPELGVSAPRGATISVWVCCVELYNEGAFDLLAPNQNLPLPLRGNCVRGLTLLPVATAGQACHLLALARHRLRCAATGLNERSSRSHCIFSVHLTRATTCPSSAQLDFVDLAGTERAGKTGNAGARLAESSRINQSLSVLGRCLKAMRANQRGGSEVVPFRGCILTRLLRAPLLSVAGQTVSLLVCASAEPATFPETLKALEFASIARRVRLKLPSSAAPPPPPSRFSMLAVARKGGAWLGPRDSQSATAIANETQGCERCADADERLRLQLNEQEWRLRQELIANFTRMMSQVEENHRRAMRDQERCLMDLVHHREDEMVKRLAEKEQPGGKRRKCDQDQTSDSEGESEELKEAMQTEISQLRAEVAAAAKTIADCQLRAAHAETQLQQALAGDGQGPSAAREAELSELLDEAGAEHLKDLAALQTLRAQLLQARQDAAVKELELDEAMTAADDSRALAEELAAKLEAGGCHADVLSPENTRLLQAENMDQAEKISSLEMTNMDQAAKISSLETTNMDQAAKISSLETTNMDQAEKISSLETTNMDQAAKITSLETTNMDQAAKISSLETTNMDQAAKISSLETTNMDQAAKISSLETTNMDQAAKIASLETTNGDQAAKILSLKTVDSAARKSDCDSKESDMELEMKRLLQQLVAVSAERDAELAKNRSCNSTLSHNANQLTRLQKEMELAEAEKEASAGRYAVQFSKMEEILRRERESKALYKRDLEAALAQLNRVTPARARRSASAGAAVNVAVSPDQQPARQTRSSKRLTNAAAPQAAERKRVRKLFVQSESCESPFSPEPLPAEKPQLRPRRK